ncbi:DegT/DnrJ/EryC1/StrS family aminotransferase [Methylobacillus sp.]|uniref:DegT/DnrJ/EryC1/StrS family aminotransferase n=1 Tax=Methylobacillus sp. TaxID=56818 RepID=UPI0012BEA995|nr:DegT/DnrJ/EryC1/StrS family aminotransferase [Methylobacillus sp.]MPS47506.1 aminotransferase DegT [Methylobacillus sp.]
MSYSHAIPLLTPLLPDRDALAPYLAKLDHNRHYSNFGPLNRALEARLATIFEQHSPHSIHVTTTSSATLALELTLSSLDLPPGSKVVVPALTFVASLTAIIRAGYIPVVVDIDPATWLLTPEIAAEAALRTDARVVLAVAAFGQPQDTWRWSEFQRQYGIHVVVDAAGAFGSQWVEAPDIPVIYSMHATKSLAAGEGGLVVSGDQAVNATVRQLSNFGINLDASAGFPVGHLSFVGSNAKLSEYHAAVAHASLDQWDAQARLRQDIYRDYRQALEHACGEQLQWQAGITLAAPTIFCLRMAGEARDRLETICQQRHIATRRWYQPLLHQHAAKVAPIIKQPTPVAEAVASGLIGLPFSPFLNQEDIIRIVDVVNLASTRRNFIHHQ